MFRAFQHPNGVVEAIDSVICGGERRISHLLVGPEGPVGDVCSEVRGKYPTAYLVALNGQRGGHLEAVLHRPA